MVEMVTGEGKQVGDGLFDAHADEIIGDLRALRKPRLVVVSGPSGVGKDTLINRMRERFPEMHYAVTATTRPQRDGEYDGIHYFFLSREEFQRKLAAGEFIESANVYGNYYGVPRSPLRQALSRGQDVVVKVDPQGAMTFRTLAPTGIFIFIAPPSIDELARRLYARKADDPDAMLLRLRTAQREMATVEHFDYVVINESDHEDETVTKINAILIAEHCRLHQHGVEL